MALARWQATITDDAGNVIIEPTITVRREIAGSPLAVLKDDRDGLVSRGNPFVGDTEGFVYFHVAGGAYQITATKGSFTRTWRYVAIGTAAETDSGLFPIQTPCAFTFDSATGDADPGPGKFRLNNATASSATAAYIDNLTAAGVTISAWLDTFDDVGSSINRGLLEIFDAADLTIFHQYTISGSVVDGTGYRKLTLAHLSGSGAFDSGAQYLIVFWGRGTTGDQGVSGASAFTRVRVVATSNVAIASALENGDTIDSVTLATNNLVLLTAQSTAAENGVYVVAASGAASRSTDFDTYDELAGSYFNVMEGTIKHDTLWQCSSNPGGTINSTAVTISQVVFGDLTAANNLSELTATAETARHNVYAAPFDALAFNGMQVNGGIDVSQELGTTGATLANNTEKYIADLWMAMYNHGAATAVVTSAQLAAASFPTALSGYSFAHQIKATTAISSPANGDFARYRHAIEGYRVARLGWGASGAQSITVAFQLYSTASGVAFLRLTNLAGDRAYHTEITVAAGWNFVTKTIAGDTSGTWQKTTSAGLIVSIYVSGKTASPATPDAWGATPAIQTTNSTNLLGTNNNLTLVTGLIVIPGVELPSSSRLPFLLRPFGTELEECLRFYEIVGGETNVPYFSMNAVNGVGYSFPIFWKKMKIVTPTITKNGTWAVSNANQPTVSDPSVRGCRFTFSATATALAEVTPNSSDDTIVAASRF